MVRYSTQNNSGQVLETSPFVCRVRVRRRGDPAPFLLARARRALLSLLFVATVAPRLSCALLRSLIHSFVKVRPREGTTNRCVFIVRRRHRASPYSVHNVRIYPSLRLTRQWKGKANETIWTRFRSGKKAILSIGFLPKIIEYKHLP